VGAAPGALAGVAPVCSEGELRKELIAACTIQGRLNSARHSQEKEFARDRGTTALVPLRLAEEDLRTSGNRWVEPQRIITRARRVGTAMRPAKWRLCTSTWVQPPGLLAPASIACPTDDQ
jgi:hypothetical protein